VRTRQSCQRYGLDLNVSLAPVLLFSPNKAQQEHDDAKEVFDILNDQLIGEVPQLLELRVPYFDPSFEAMIRMQCKFAEEGYEKMSGVQRYDHLKRFPGGRSCVSVDTLRRMSETTMLQVN